MKKVHVFFASLLLSSSVFVNADTGVMIGVAYNFGGGQNSNYGVSLKVLSDDEEDKAVGALGFSYFPNANAKFGVDLGVGYLFENGAVTASYDIFNKQPQLALGYVDTDDGVSHSPGANPIVETDYEER